MQKANPFKLGAVGIGIVFCTASVLAQSVGAIANTGGAVQITEPMRAQGVNKAPPDQVSAASSTAQTPSAVTLDTTFGEAVVEAKRERERALKAELEVKKRAEMLRLMPSVGTAQNPFSVPQAGAVPDGAALTNAEPLLVGLSGITGRYTAELWHESKIYRVRSDQLPFRHRLWTLVQINEHGVVLNTRQKWTGVERDGHYRLSAPLPGTPELALSTAASGLGMASAYQANSLAQRLPSFPPASVK